ncbi:hypothetical protein [Ponticaulis koreensis]|uniref:hypothetical protein n=1 Tax=Ponticaulis koreensis TaxID=1123045 RepID=UPI0003B6F7A8|nr:hypothetical protein [Ponticaulis koreensis]
MQTQLGLRVLTFKEGDVFVAQAIERDICVQANDFDTLKKRFECVVMLELEKSHGRQDDTPLSGIDAAPQEYFDLWMSLENDHPIDRFKLPELAVEMASAA